MEAIKWHMGNRDTHGLDRPATEDELAHILCIAADCTHREQYARALEICDWLMSEPITEIAGRRERAAVRAHMDDLGGAVADLELVVSADPVEPADLHTLGILLLQAGSTRQAIERFAEAVRIGDAAGSTYYRNSSLLFASEAKLRLGDFADAFADASQLPEQYRVHVDGTGMRSREDIMQEAQLALQRKAPSAFQFKK